MKTINKTTILTITFYMLLYVPVLTFAMNDPHIKTLIIETFWGERHIFGNADIAKQIQVPQEEAPEYTLRYKVNQLYLELEHANHVSVKGLTQHDISRYIINDHAQVSCRLAIDNRNKVFYIKQDI